MRRHILSSVLVLLVVAAVSAQSSQASAQTMKEGKQVDTYPAGVVGLGLLGAEVGLLIPPVARLHEHWWAWALFPTLGAAGGVAGGIVALDGVDSKVNVALIGVGMGLVIPAIVGALAIKSRRERQAFEQADGPGVFRLGSVRINAPSLSPAQVFTSTEQLQWGVRQRTSWRFSLLSGTF